MSNKNSISRTGSAVLAACLGFGASTLLTAARRDSEVIRAERIELASPGCRPSIVMEAANAGGIIRMQSALKEGTEDAWELEISTGLLSGPKITMKDASNMGMASVVIELRGTPKEPFIEVRDSVLKRRLLVRSRGMTPDDIVSILVTDAAGKPVLQDSDSGD